MGVWSSTACPGCGKKTKTNVSMIIAIPSVASILHVLLTSVLQAMFVGFVKNTIQKKTCDAV